MHTSIHIHKKASFSGHRDCVYGLTHPANSPYFYSTSGDGMVVKWDIEHPDSGQLIAKTTHSVYAAHVVPTNHTLYIGQNFEGVHEIDINSHVELRSLQCTRSHIFDIKSTENLLFLACGNGEIVVLDIIKWIIVHRIPASNGKSARCLAVNIQKNELVAGYSDNCIRVFSLADFHMLFEWEAHSLSVFSLQFSPDGRYVYSGSRDAHVKLWQVENGYLLSQSIVAHMYAIHKISFSPNGSLFATASMDKTIKIWETATQKLLKVIDKSRFMSHSTSVNNVCWVSDELLLSASDDKQIYLWEVLWH